jgi:O-antigen/teichoic acid export membrane protein
MGSAKKIVRGAVWTTMANIINGIYGFISVPLLIVYFGKSNYGLIGLALSVNIYLNLMDLGLNSTNIRFFSNWLANNDYDRVNKLFGTSMSFYGVVGLLNAMIMIVIGLFARQIFHLNEEQGTILMHLFFILAISAFISWYTSCFDQLIKANEYVGWTEQVTLLAKLLQCLVLILTLTLKFGIETFYILTTFSMFIVIPFCIHKIRKLCPYIKFYPHFDRAVFKQILPYSLNIFSFGIFQFSFYNLRPVFLGLQGTPSDITDFRIMNGIAGIAMMFGGSFLGILLPSVTKAVAQNNTQAINHVAYDGTKYISILLCFCSFGVISVAPELLNIYVGPKFSYLTIWLILWLLILTESHNQAISSLILAGSNIRAITYSSVCACILGLLVCWFTIPSLKVGGTVVAFLVYNTFQILFYYLYYWPRKMHIDSWRVFRVSYAPYLLIGLFFSWVCHNMNFVYNQWAEFFIKGISFAVFYFITIFFVLNKKEKIFFVKLLKRKS